MKSRVVRLIGASVAALVVITVAPAGTAGAAARAGSLSTSRTTAIGLESVAFRGSLPPRASRAVQLQRYTGRAWVRVLSGRSSSAGAFALSSRMPSRAGRYAFRVFAPAARVAGASRPAVVTPSRTVTVVAQTASLSAPASALMGRSVTVSARFTPARAGRRVRLQHNGSGDWTTIATRTESSSGRVSFTLRPSWLGDRSLRAVALSSAGAPAAASRSRRMKVALDPAVGGSLSELTNGDSETSTYPTVSDDGKYVAFTSFASNLVANDDNGHQSDVFVRDVAAGTTVRIDPGNGESSDASISGDGAYVAFLVWPSDDGATPGVYLWRRSTGVVQRVSPDVPDRTFASAPEISISDDGRFVSYKAFVITGEDPDSGFPLGQEDVFFWDRSTGTTTRITSGDGTSTSPVVSGDGLHVVFTSYATNLAGTDPNGDTPDVYDWDRLTGTTARILRGVEAQDLSVSDNGRFVVFDSSINHVVANQSNREQNLFVLDRTAGTTTRLTNGNAESERAVVSDDGGRVGFRSAASNLVSGDDNAAADAFVWDRASGTFKRLPTADDEALVTTLSGDGRSVALSTYAYLSDGDTNGYADIYLWRLPS